MSKLKRYIEAVILLLCLFLAGCSPDNPSGKLCRIEFLSAGTEEVLKTLDKQTQEQVFSLLQVDEWEETDKPEGELTPEYKILVYQEKTPALLSFLPFFSSGSDYIQILEFTMYKDSQYVLEHIDTDEIINNSFIPNISVSSYYAVSGEILKDIYDEIS